MQIRTNSFLYIFHGPTEKNLKIFEPFEKRYFEVQDTILFDILNFAHDFKNRVSLQRYIKLLNPKVDHQSVKSFIDSLIKGNLLVTRDSQIYKIVNESQDWFKHGWSTAFYYHLASRDYKFLDYSKEEDVLHDRRLMKKYAKISTVPPIYKTYSRNKTYKLAKIHEGPKLKFPPNNNEEVDLNKENLETLLHLVFGEVRSINFPVFGKSLLKTSPSGGSRHPSEAYIILLKDIGFPKGVYHYSVKNHGLELISKKDWTKYIKKIFFMLNHYPRFRPQAVIVISSLFKRSMWRYRGEPRSFRVIFFDIGHLLSTLRIVGQAVGLEVLVGQSFDDSKAREILNLNTGNERPLYFAAIGRNYQS